MRGCEGVVDITHVSINRGGGIRMLLPRERALVGGALSLLYWMAEHYYQCPRVTQITTKKRWMGGRVVTGHHDLKSQLLSKLPAVCRHLQCGRVSARRCRKRRTFEINPKPQRPNSAGTDGKVLTESFSILVAPAKVEAGHCRCWDRG